MKKKQDRRQKILCCAAQLFADKGYVEVSMRAIATKVGVTVADLYYYFPSKEKLIQDTLVSVFAEGLKPLMTLLESDKPIEQKFSDYIDVLVNALNTNDLFSRLFIRESCDKNAVRKNALMNKIFEGPYHKQVDLIQAFTQTAYPHLDMMLITSLLVGYHIMSNAFVPTVGLENLEPDPDKLLRSITSFVVGGLKAHALPD